jgi:hypothetical protein
MDGISVPLFFLNIWSVLSLAAVMLQHFPVREPGSESADISVSANRSVHKTQSSHCDDTFKAVLSIISND